ncbi:pyridoxal kinase PdxY [Naumannella halotolerans]|uniref:pyridoxal kinase PdxY n=1 Tax=Naumannella halotolerans TaxID=993414 RepID=UPI001FB99372|nr:pyridoxal kinase PdxY [Naumannella halotolerans]
MTTILSIQSSVAYGHVGNSAATFPLMRRGYEVMPVITVHFSNHTGYGAWRGPVLQAADIVDVVTGIDERGALAHVDGVLSGYQGAEETGQAVLQALALVRRRNPRAEYCCDPVMGDVGRGFYVRPGIPEFMRDTVVPAADIVTPNQFELAFLADTPIASLSDVLTAADRIRAQGPGLVLVTSVEVPELATDGPGVSMVAVDAHGAWAVTTPKLDRNFTGSGDLTASTFFSEHLSGADAASALATTAAVVYAVLRITDESGQAELALVAAQDAIASPPEQFAVQKLR